ncbi:discoidin domain-containing protein [Methylococcus sp. EFPC2]|uniref:galactose-binding domain-containing protein n=1 Tax=Methylococcus sp. EFPC2 TaxID=2812648 RepID=UPI0019688B4A|nr:discoidin domain-containing protein [Methylococcus sp. EFPC2]QSA97837.1 discoidin domain-containing protein [Methylococcus sp. EFPC2]
MQGEILDAFGDLSGWTAISSGQVQARLSPDTGPAGSAMRIEFDFRGGGGFVVARKLFPLDLPESYSFAFQIKGDAPANIFEFKLVDASGQNVWRYRVEAFPLPPDWQTVRIRNSQIDFAWGPLGGGPARKIAAIELVFAAGPGGAGSVSFAELQFRDDTYRATPLVSASASAEDCAPCNVLAPDAAVWRSATVDPAWLTLDFQQERQFGALVIHWDEQRRAREFAVETSPDDLSWQSAYSTTQGAGERSYVYLPGTICRYVRLQLKRGIGDSEFGIRQVEIKPFEFARDLNGFFEGIAHEWPTGFYPKYFSGRQTYWTPVGTGSGGTQALINEEGLVEVDKGRFSIEPFLYADGRLISWADAERTQTLEAGYLPIPSSAWLTDDWRLTTTAFAADYAGRPVLFIRYRIDNRSAEARPVSLYAAIRPFQVTPTWQHWRSFGGMTPVRHIDYRDGIVWVDATKAVTPLRPPQGYGAAAFAEGAVTEFLGRGELPSHAELQDEFGYGSAALRFDLQIPGASHDEVYIAIPFGNAAEVPIESLSALTGADAYARAVELWKTQLGTFDIRLPPRFRHLTDTLRTAAAHILINRDGPALHPGPRRYSRAWIRDGVLMGAALARVGCAEALRDFMRWYAGFQTEDGNFPDCMDPEETEWLPEFDAYGQFVYGIAEYWRFSGDRDFLAEMWPAVGKTLDYMEALRRRRLTDDYRQAERLACYGLLPESMSHEGYMAHPVHAYWDDFWALRGLKDAVTMAEALGYGEEAARLAARREEFCRHLYLSLDRVIAERDIDFVPGSVEFADFDPAATAIALTPVDEAHRLPQAAINRTFDRYLTGFRERASGKVAWNNYSAYEIRIVGALIRLGRRTDALELLDFLLADRRIKPWNQWPEISWRDPDGPSFIGDLPHTWISGEYILSVRSLFAYEREADESLVIAAGVSEEWLADGGEVAVENLPTWYGKLSYSLQYQADGRLRLKLSGELTPPLGGIVVLPPLPRPIQQVEVNGEAFHVDSREDGFRIRQCPAEAVISF